MEPARRPVVLFDGVCNLCDAAVGWLIDRDPQAHFAFASLQSRAAREALGEHLTEEQIADLPDAMVLIDEAGVHTRSTAALRIAARLGQPWKLLGVFLWLPEMLRDGVYRVIARNRYRWFGHREACRVPTPELSARFLDAEEPALVVEIVDPRRRDEAVRTPVRSWALRFVIAYLVLYMLPFPLQLLSNLPRVWLIGDIPGLGTAVGWVLGAWTSITNPLVTMTGNLFFGVEALPGTTGSGDQTFNYVELFFDLLSALLVSAVWSAVVGWRRLSALTFDVSRVLTRYYLGWYLLIYGWVKVFPLQMPAPGPDRLIQSYGDSSPMGIAWTFIGASMAYEIFSGLAELVAGYLLFWRRTSLLGALAAMAVMMNVMAINYFFDVPVKLFSTHLFLYGLFIAAPDLPRLVGLFGFNLPVARSGRVAFWRRLGWSARWVGVANLVLVGSLTWFHVGDNLEASRTRGVLAETPRLEAIYRVESFEQGGLVDRENEDAARWVRVGVNMPSLATIQRATGESVRMLMAIDTIGGTLSFYDRGGRPPAMPHFSFTEPEPDVLRLQGNFEGHPTVVLLRRSEEGALLTERGFRWINEFPFNR